MIIRCRKSFLLTAFLLIAGGCLDAAGSAVSEPWFHFNFSGVKSGSMQNVPDLKNKSRICSRLNFFVVQEDALRIASASDFSIPAKELPALTQKFTLMAWIKSGMRGQDQPVFVKGVKGDIIQFDFGVNHLWPYGEYTIGKDAYGIHVFGSGHVVDYILASKKFSLSPKPVEFVPGKWSLIAWVFDQGTLEIYLDGKKIFRFPATQKLTLKENGAPLNMGCFRRADKDPRNERSGDMLMNDIRLWTEPLSAEAIAEIYAKESSVYAKRPSHSTWDPNPEWYCYDYARIVTPGYDPMYQTRVPFTETWLKNKPEAQPISGNPDTKIELRNGSAHLIIGGKEYFPLLAASSRGAFKVDVFSPDDKYENMLEDPAAQGFTLMQVMPHSWRDVPLIWKGYKKYDFQAVDLLIRKALKVNPNARIQFGIHPEMIAWFQKQYPESNEVSLGQWSSKGEKILGFTGNPGSDIWVDAADDLFYELVKHIESQDYASHIYDYKVWMSGGGEWHWPICFTGSVGGYSKATEASFRNYLKEKYHTDAELQKAWNNPTVSLGTAVVPSPEERKAAERLMFRDPKTAQSCYDFIHFLNDRTFAELKRHTESVKRACGGKKTVTVYFGYALYLLGNPAKLQSGCSVFEKVLDLKSVDNIATPICYKYRGLGEPGHNQNQFTATALMHNKLIWQENDLRTWLNPSTAFAETATEKDSIQQLRRGFAQAVTGSCGFWYFPGYQYHCESIVRELAHWKELSDDMLSYSRTSVAEAALIFDEESIFDLSIKYGPFLHGHGNTFVREASFAGAPLDSWMLNDLADSRMPDYKVYFFVNAFRISPERRAMIQRKLAKNHALAVWSYAPGMITDNGFDQESMRKLTGIRFRILSTPAEGALKLNGNKHTITQYAGTFTPYEFGPLVMADDPESLTLGTFASYPALSLKKNPDYSSLWTLMPLNRRVVAGIYEFAGVHRYQKQFDVINANKNFLMIHAASAGTKEIELKEPSDVVELFSGRKIGSGIRTFTDKLEFGDTRLYRIVPTPEK